MARDWKGRGHFLPVRVHVGQTLTLTFILPLIKTEYWDRAGGGGNISYDWGGTSRMIHTLMALDKVKSSCK